VYNKQKIKTLQLPSATQFRDFNLVTDVHNTKHKPDRQCTYNVTLRRICATMLQWKSNKCYIFWVCFYL